MRRALWIAADVVMEWRALGARLLAPGLTAAWWPFFAGVVDGLTALAPFWREGMGVRRSLLMISLGPALAVLSLFLEVVLPRRQRREMEPLLASPATDLELGGGLAIPMVGLMMVLPVLSGPLTLLGFRIASGRLPQSPAAELGLHYLSSLVAALWLAAPAVDALFRARGGEGLALRLALGYAVLAIVDLILIALRLLGAERAVLPALLVSLAAGAAALFLVSRRLDREELVLRR